MMLIQLNGERRELKDELRLSDLLKEFSLAPERVAVELNHQVVRRNEWTNTILREGDRVEIVHFVGGGSRSLRDLEGVQSSGPCKVGQILDARNFYFSGPPCKVLAD